jgi:glyoxylase-like metal-dependent hydrolase (beta-lactamase superfamily II)
VEEFEKWHIEGMAKIPTLNIPYFDLIEKGAKEDFNESIANFIKTQLAEQLPKNEKIVVVCAKGGSSAIIADVLTSLHYQATSLAGGMKSWGDFYNAKTIVQSPELSIFQLARVSRGCLSYVVIADGMAAVIDPLRNIQPYIDLIKEHNAKLQFVLDTHAHADHISSGKVLAEKFAVPYYLHPYDGIHPMDLLPATIAYEPSWANKIYKVGKSELKALHIPGHTLGNQAFLLNGKYLFSGDSIFIQSIARPDLGGQAETWTALHYESLKKLLELPDDVLVLPAHFSGPQETNAEHAYSATLGTLRKSNEGLVMAQKSLKEFSDYILGNLPRFPKEYIDIKRVNIGLLQADEELVSELELGKNICAVSQTLESAKTKK